MKINKNKESLKTAALIFIDFQYLYQLIAIDFYGLLLMLLIIGFE